MKSTLTLHSLKYLYHDCDLTIEQIALKLKYSSSTIHRWLKKFNLLKSKKDIYKKINSSRKIAFKEKYGTDHYMKSKIGYNNYQKSLLKTIGVSHIMKLETVRKKQQQTSIERYGVPFSIQYDKSNKKRLETLKSRYGDFNKYLAKKCAHSHIKTSPMASHIKTKFGIIKVRSKLESKLIKLISGFTDVIDLSYEPFVIETNDVIIVPDLLINNNLIIEIKYFKYLSKNKPNNLDKKGSSMWKNAKKKLPILSDWCNKNGFRFKIATEKQAKRFKSLNEFVANLEVLGPDFASFS